MEQNGKSDHLKSEQNGKSRPLDAAEQNGKSSRPVRNPIPTLWRAGGQFYIVTFASLDFFLQNVLVYVSNVFEASPD